MADEQQKTIYLTLPQLLITIGKLYDSYKPGCEGWAKLDQACLDAVLNGGHFVEIRKS